MGYSPWVHKESNATEHAHKIFILLFFPLHIPCDYCEDQINGKETQRIVENKEFLG